MSKGQFEKQDQAKAYSLYRPIPPPQLLDVVLNYMREELNPPFDEAVDVGCGTGQSTVLLAPHFRHVTGYDVSKAQIWEAQVARNKSNISYRVSPAEEMSLPNNSVHLLTAGTSFHWFDVDRFFEEAHRVLVPNGVLAVYSSCTIYPCTGDEEKDRVLYNLTNKLLYEDLEPYRAPNVHQLFQEYRNTVFPFEDVIRISNIKHVYYATAADASGYVKSMSTFQNLRNIDATKADLLIHDYQKKLMEIINQDSLPEVTPLNYCRNFFLILCRKSSANNSN